MKRIITGIKPTNIITLGNYIGSIKNLISAYNEKKDYDFLVFIADLHSLTITQDKNELKKNILDLAKIYISCGFNEENIYIFRQSKIKSHTYLSWILECNTSYNLLTRMTQFKDHYLKNKYISTGLFTYPVLMASDILLYDATYVPVGEDQKQHLEITKDIAIKFNSIYNETFTIPEPLIMKQGSRIMSLKNPEKKMSKSDDNPNSYISILDDYETILKKIKSAVTDSFAKINYDKKNQLGLSNLIDIFASIKNVNQSTIVDKYKNSSYKEFKEDLAKVIYDELKPIQDKFYSLNDNDVLNILIKNEMILDKIALDKILSIEEKIGL